jgi:hypothetical protein
MADATQTDTVKVKSVSPDSPVDFPLNPVDAEIIRLLALIEKNTRKV